MAIQLDYILLQSWERGIPIAGGNDDESNLKNIVKLAMSCESQATRALLKRKITLYFVSKKESTEKLEQICRPLFGVKVRFKDEESYIPSAVGLKLLTIAPKYRIAFAKNKLVFPELTMLGFKDLMALLNGKNEVSFASLIEIYLTFEAMPKIRETLEYELNNSNVPKLARFFYFLRRDPYFKKKIEQNINQLSSPEYILFIKEVGLKNLDWIHYESKSRIKIELIAALAEKHDSAVVNLKGDFFSIIRNKRRIKLMCQNIFTNEDVEVIRRNNPDLAEIEFIKFLPQHRALLSLITPKTQKVKLEDCTLTYACWEKFITNLGHIDLIVKGTRLNQQLFDVLSSRLRSLTLEGASGIYFTLQIPFKSLSISRLEEFGPQPFVGFLNVDCLSYWQDFHKVLPFFPNLHTFSFTSPYDTCVLIDQEFFLRLYKAAPDLNQLILNGVRWGKFPALRTKFLNLIQLDISRTGFFESNPETLLNKLCFIFPNLKKVVISQEDEIHHEPHLAILRERFSQLEFFIKQSG